MPTALTYPGVYVEEISSGVHTIAGVATSIAAFVGWAPQGPVAEATLVQSWSDYATQFGGLDARSKLGYAVNQFFANGGSECYIVRLVWDGSLPPAAGNPAPCATAFTSGLGYATAQIIATVGSISASATVGLGTPVLQSIAVTPAAMPPMPIGATITLTATPIYSDSGHSPALAGVTWQSSNTGVLTVVAGTGAVTAVGAGTAVITAMSGLVSGAVAITVTSAGFTSITVSAPSSIAVGQTQQLVATAAYSDNTSPDVTQLVAWASATATVAGISTPPAHPAGLVLAKAIGTSDITATIPWAQGGTSPSDNSQSVTVTAAVPVSEAIYPANPTIQATQTPTLAVWGLLSNAAPNSAPVELVAPAFTGAWTWVSSNTAAATVDGTGKVTPVAAGTTTVTATSGALSASTTVTVTGAHLNTISISPPSVTVASGLTQQLKATGVYSDGTSVDLTNCVTWTPTAETSISVNGVLTGTGAAAAAGIQAAWAGKTGTASVTVTAPVLVSIKVTASGSATSIPTGQTLQFTATSTYSDGTSPTITPIWSASPPGLVNVTSTGLASALVAGGSLTLFATSPGAWGNSLQVSVSVQPPPNGNRFNLLVQQMTPSGQLQTLESFVNLSASPADPSYVVTVVDNDSNYITFVNSLTNQVVAPAAAPSATGAPVALKGGADGAVLVPASDQNFELAMLSNATGGVNLLDRVDIFNLLCVPGETDAPAISSLQAYCQKKRAFLIVDAPQFTKTSSLISSGPVGSTSGSITAGTAASNSAFYYPWVLAPDPLAGNRPALFPPCGFVAGIFASTDADRGVWKAPAGINASLTGNSGLQYVLTDPENGSLNPQAVNCLRQFKVYGDVVWGARTLAGNDQTGSEYKYVPIRRLALYIESSLFDGTKWVVFEPNDETLWGQIRLNVGTFMQGLFLQGAFAGTTPAQAYFVKCDAENNPDSSVALGIVNILVGFAPLYPAEFVVIQIEQIAASS